ncbi:pleiotropic drug resistance protein 3-like [Trifolium pratense]|uniref:Pleiotropic drug resistance protein 3-like n=1 Tax=Trifolium pratense TaxID=57577 RepID=A0A2K3LSA3_TRIPR|nr:pleiotropic drug resistance protein 3-like [Trifolium pratense]PNX89186.1 pleiotropic drug resistance protein 3-like [Trifolium pratense]
MELTPRGRNNLTPRGRNQGHVVTFERDADSFVEEDKELQSKWAAIEKLPTFKRIKTSFVDEITQEENGSRWQRSSSKRVVDVTKLGAVDKRLFIDKLIKHIENDNLNLLQKLRERMESTCETVWELMETTYDLVISCF